MRLGCGADAGELCSVLKGQVLQSHIGRIRCNRNGRAIGRDKVSLCALPSLVIFQSASPSGTMSIIPGSIPTLAIDCRHHQRKETGFSWFSPRGPCQGHRPRGLRRSDPPLCRHFGRHALTRVRTAFAQLGALLQDLILSCYLHAVVPALPAHISAETTHAFVKRRSPKEILSGRFTNFRTVEQ